MGQQDIGGTLCIYIKRLLIQCFEIAHSLSGKTNDAASWDAIFKYFNVNHGKGNVGYQAGEKIAVKINLNNSTAPNPGVTKVNRAICRLQHHRQYLVYLGS